MRLREQTIDVIAALGVGEHVDPSGPFVVAAKNRIDHVRKIAQLHRERFRLRTLAWNFRDHLLGQIGHWDFSGYLRSHQATAASVRTTLLGEAGWHRADFAEARTLDDGPNLSSVDQIAQEPTGRRGRPTSSRD